MPSSTSFPPAFFPEKIPAGNMSRIKFHFSALAIFCLWQTLAQAQVDTALALPEVEVLETHLRSNANGERQETWDSTKLQTFAHDHIGTLLEQQSGVFVKNYGPGSIATLSTRGSSAGHTLVTWNGLPIQSPMLGLLDVSLLPAAFADDVSLRYGGNSSLWGSGAIGGVLAVQNRAVFRSPLQLRAQSGIGSFGRLDHSLGWQWGNEKFGTATTLLHQTADNDFTYLTANGTIEKTLTNSARKQQGLLQEFYWKPADNQQLALHIWLQNAHREIPPTTVQARSEATQDDASLRTALHWKRLGESSVWQARLGFFNEKIDYRDPQTGLIAISHFWTTIGDVEGQFQLRPDRRLSVGMTQTLTRAFADEYKAPPTESRTAMFASLRQNFRNLEIQLTGRQELVDGNMLGFTPSLALSLPFGKHFSAHGKLSRNYRLPTLNDRFWRPGGNPDLLPESGWSQELGLYWQREIGTHRFQYELTGFNRRIHEWVLWSLRAGENFWSANNLAEVHSWGTEQRFTWHWHLSKMIIKLATGYDYTRSTNERAIENPKIEAGQQLIYVPVHQAFASLSLEAGKWQGSFNHRLTSSVRTTSTPLDGYHLGQLRLGRFIEKKPFSGSLFFQIDNLWDASYRVVERRPMPGRSFMLGIALNVQPNSSSGGE